MDVRINDTSQQAEQPTGPISGEVLAVEAEVVRVKLASGEIGTLKRSTAQDAAETLSPGVVADFRILERREDGSLDLAQVAASHPQTAAEASFDSEVVHLKQALQNNHHHTPPVVAPPSRHDSTREERLRAWISRVDREMTRLRKSRAKRLDEEFYSSS